MPILGVSLWVAVDSTSFGLIKFEQDLIKKLLSADMNLTTCRKVQVRGRSDYTTLDTYSQYLFQVLKDHNCNDEIEMAEKSYYHAVRNAALSKGVVLPVYISNVGDETPASLIFRNISRETKDVIRKAIQDIKFTNLVVKVIDETPTDNVEDSVAPCPKLPTNAVCKATDVVNRLMKKKGYSLCNGLIYKKAPEAKHTSVFCSSVKDFLLKTLSNAEVANLLTPYINVVSNLLSQPSCRLIIPIQIDYDLIEVLPVGTCFIISEKRFIEYETLPNNTTPRACVKYEYREDKVPYLLPFVTDIKNSFPRRSQRVKFLQKYYQLLLHKKFPMKEPKLLLEGPADSGKTSWVTPFQGIIPNVNIASVTREWKFAAHMINENTELVFMDEWTADSLSCEDAKRILQGGSFHLPQKHAEASRVNYKSGFFITTNVLPDFGHEIDQNAIMKRLNVFHTKALPKKDNSVSGWLRLHCMDVFHYCAELLKDTPLFESCAQSLTEMDASTGEGAIYNDFDGDPSSLLDGDDFTTLSTDVDDVESINFNSISLTQSEIDSAFLQADNDEPDRYTIIHPDFDDESSPSEPQYFEKVLRLVEVWDELDIFDDHTQRFEIRYRNGWTGSDTAYDAWLVISGLEREEFDADRARKRQKLMVDNADYNEESESENADRNHDFWNNSESTQNHYSFASSSQCTQAESSDCSNNDPIDDDSKEWFASVKRFKLRKELKHVIVLSDDDGNGDGDNKTWQKATLQFPAQRDEVILISSDDDN